jgi:hypothetical protein
MTPSPIVFARQGQYAQDRKRIILEIDSKGKPALTHDSSTNHLIFQCRKLKEAL